MFASKKFRHIPTGEIVTQVPISRFSEYEEVEDNYIFTREVKVWGVEAGDYYNPQLHMIMGGAEKLLADGIIEKE